VDKGATHNFMTTRLAREVGLKDFKLIMMEKYIGIMIDDYTFTSGTPNEDYETT